MSACSLFNELTVVGCERRKRKGKEQQEVQTGSSAPLHAPLSDDTTFVNAGTWETVTLYSSGMFCKNICKNRGPVTFGPADCFILSDTFLLNKVHLQSRRKQFVGWRSDAVNHHQQHHWLEIATSRLAVPTAPQCTSAVVGTFAEFSVLTWKARVCLFSCVYFGFTGNKESWTKVSNLSTSRERETKFHRKFPTQGVGHMMPHNKLG